MDKFVAYLYIQDYREKIAAEADRVAFRKSPVGKLFHQFFGENTLRATSQSRSASSARCSITPGLVEAEAKRRGSSAPTERCSSSTAHRHRTRSSGTAMRPAGRCRALSTAIATSRSCTRSS